VLVKEMLMTPFTCRDITKDNIKLKTSMYHHIISKDINHVILNHVMKLEKQ
jgi:hypothetical protein